MSKQMRKGTSMGSYNYSDYQLRMSNDNKPLDLDMRRRREILFSSEMVHNNNDKHKRLLHMADGDQRDPIKLLLLIIQPWRVSAMGTLMAT